MSIAFRVTARWNALHKKISEFLSLSVFLLLAQYVVIAKSFKSFFEAHLLSGLHGVRGCERKSKACNRALKDNRVELIM